jgi:transcriptional regulator with XRE-family HTH domain
VLEIRKEREMSGEGIPGPGDLGRRVAARRERLGWSRKQLAVRVGLSVAYLTYIETHPAVVTMACLVGLADALGTTVAALLGADPADQDGATTAPAWGGAWIAGVRTGLPGERPLPSLS